MELGQVLAPLADFREKMLFIRGLYNEQALKGNIHSSQTGNLLSGAPLASGGEIRSGTSVDQWLAHDLRPLDQGARAWCWAARSRTRRSTRITRCSTARTSRGPRRPRPTPLELYPALAFDRLFKDEVRPRRQERARRRAGRRQRPPPPDQHDRPAQARRVPRLGPRRRAADRRRGQAGRAAGLAADARQAQHPPAARRHPPGHRRPHAADVRHPGPRLPDRHHADHHAQAEQRPLVAPVPATWAWTT